MNLKEFIKSSIYVTPNFPDISTKRYKVGIFSLIGMIAAYTLIVAILLIGLLMITPSEEIVFFFENSKLEKQSNKIENFEHRIEYLTQEINKLTNTNNKLKFALRLSEGDTTLVKKVETENNILKAFLTFISVLKNDSTETFFISPTNGFINQEFNLEKGHLGIDFGVPLNEPVVASADGFIVFAGNTARDGNIIIIEHKNKYKTIYKHCAIILKKDRDYVEQGETIALSGNSGYNSSGPHLHFEIWHNGNPINPKKNLLNLK